MKVIHGTSCSAAGHCSTHHYWTAGNHPYTGDLCSYSVWVNGVEELRPCPNLNNPSVYKVPGMSLTSRPQTPMPQGHHYTGPGRYAPGRRLL
jgi:hypothetical protein